MNLTNTPRRRILRNAAVFTLGFTLCAGLTRADDPYPPLDPAAQKVVEDARRQMRAEGVRRQVFEERQRNWEARNVRLQQTQKASDEPPRIAERR
jgi:hypothetical protein